MGVKGLTTFIEENQRSFLRKEKIHDCSLVIDGFGLVYHLYFGSDLDVKHGGEFLALAEVTHEFFSNLKECNIKPYVLFDGPIDDDKLPCVLTRLQDRVKDVQRVLNGSTARLLPIFSVDVLLHYLWSHNIPSAVSLIEADCEIAALANYLKCPVLSEDSDYFIYKIENGYIPFRQFYWDNVWLDKSSRRKSIVCHKYHTSHLCDKYEVPQHFLPYLSILLGNDWIDNRTFKQLLTNLPSHRSTSKQKQRRRIKAYSKVESVLHWLSQKRDRESSIVDKILNSVPSNQTDATRSKIEMSRSMYLEIPDLTKTLEVLGLVEHVPGDPDDPYQEIKDRVRKRLVHPLALNLLESTYIALPVVMSDPMQPSPHAPAFEIRTMLYRVLLRRYRLKSCGAEFLFVQEFNKVDMFYKKSRTVGVFTSLCPMCDQHHLVEDGCKMATPGGEIVQQHGFTTLDLLCKILKLRYNANLVNCFKNVVASILPEIDAEFMEYLDVLMISTLFWVKKTSPKPDFIFSMVLTIIWAIKRTLCVKHTERISIREPQPPSPGRRGHDHQLKQGGPGHSSQYSSDSHAERSSEPFNVPDRTGIKSSNGLTQGVPGQAGAEGPLHSVTSPARTNRLDAGQRRTDIPIPLLPEVRFLQLLCDRTIRTVSGAREVVDPRFDDALLHSAAQWLCILNAVYLLHQVVDLPSSKFAMQEFSTSSSLLHDVHARVKRLVDFTGSFNSKDFNAALNVISGRLESLPAMKDLLQAFINILMQQ